MESAMLAFALSVGLSCQAPAPQDSRPLDVLVLKNGDSLEGRITTELDGYVEIRLGEGAVVGIGRAQIAAVQKGAGSAAPPTAALPPRSEWFLLHDASGAAVGWLNTSVTARPDGGLAIAEEYEFVQGRTRYQVTSLAIADRTLQPRSCYFRERVCAPVLASLQLPNLDTAGQAQTVGDERIVEATVRGDRLHVQRLDRTGRRERELPWSTDASFPLLLRAVARHDGRATGPRSLFDPASEEIVVQSHDAARPRTVMSGGARTTVHELTETSAMGRNTEWIDASARTVRRELAGPALVAVPSSAGRAPGAVGSAAIAAARVAEAGGSFGLWVPNPAWTVLDDVPAGQLRLANAAHGASIALARLEHLDAGCALDTAVEAVANWFALLHPELQITGREDVTVRERRAIRLLAAGRRGGASWQASVLVLPQRDRHLVLVCTAPAAAWEELAADFAFLQQSIELEAQSLAPKLQGPLATPRSGKTEPAPQPAAGATPRSSPPPTASRRGGVGDDRVRVVDASEPAPRR